VNTQKLKSTKKMMKKLAVVVVLLLGGQRVRGQRGRDEDLDEIFPTIFRDDALPSRPTKSDQVLVSLAAGDTLSAPLPAVVSKQQATTAARTTTTTERPRQNPVRFPGGSGQGREVPSVPLFITNSAPGFATGGLGDDYEYDYDVSPLPSGPTRQPAIPQQRFGRRTEDAVVEAILQASRSKTSRFTAPRQEALQSPSAGRTGPLRVTSNLDTLEQTQLFTQMDPHQQQFIQAPKANAGSLPLASEM